MNCKENLRVMMGALARHQACEGAVESISELIGTRALAGSGMACDWSCPVNQGIGHSLVNYIYIII